MTVMEYYGISYKGLSAGAFGQKVAHLKYIRQEESKRNMIKNLFG